MKYFNYFKKKLVEKFDNIKSVSLIKIEFHNGLFFYYDFQEIESEIGNSDYKQGFYETIYDLHKRMNTYIDTDPVETSLKALREELVEDKYSVDMYLNDKAAIIEITRREDGYKRVVKFDATIIATDMFHNMTIPGVIDEMLATPLLKEKNAEDVTKVAISNHDKKPSSISKTENETIIKY